MAINTEEKTNGHHVNGNDASTNQHEINGARTKQDENQAVAIAERDGEYVPTYDNHGYYVREQPMGTKRRIKVVIMGAGAAGLCFFKMAEKDMELLDIQCYEKNADVGGTWYENRYPGCACDIPSVNYQFSWKIKLWTHYYSFAPEIYEYLKDIEREGDFINKYIKVRHQIEHAEWDDKGGLWRFKVRNLETNEVLDDAAEFFINGGGVLNSWKWPDDIPGWGKFKGKTMHTANYEPGYDLKDKRVAVLGAGSSGVQVVSKIQKEVKQLYHWIRSPIWITAGFAQTWAGTDGANFRYTKEQLDFMDKNPEKYLEYRKQIENELNQRFKFIIKGSNEAKAAREFSEEQMERKMNGDKRLCEKIIPVNFNPGCRRPTPAPGYLEALVAPNAKIFTESMGEITEKGFKDQEGNEYEIDVLLCATGFDTSWVPRFPFIAHGKDLRKEWDQANGGVTSYISIGVPNFPNHFSYCGPYGPLGHGSFMPLIETWTQYIFQAMRKLQTENIKSMAPQMRAAQNFRQHADLFLQRTAWTSRCRSWFKNGKEDGQAAIWPGSRVQYLELMDKPRWEDYNIEWWDDNRFTFLGNGFSIRETDGRDITYYLGNLDPEGKDVQPNYGEELINKLAGWAVGY